jgi:hypothetical protein
MMEGTAQKYIQEKEMAKETKKREEDKKKKNKKKTKH